MKKVIHEFFAFGAEVPRHHHLIEFGMDLRFRTTMRTDNLHIKGIFANPSQKKRLIMDMIRTLRTDEVRPNGINGSFEKKIVH